MMSQVYKTQTRIRFHLADPANIMFFGNILQMSHDIYEDFLLHLGFQWDEYFKNKEFMIPIRHAECDYLSPLHVGEVYDVQVSISQIRDTSFEVKYQFMKNNKAHAVTKIVHAFLSSKTKQKTPVPDFFLNKIKPYLESSK